MGYFIDEHNFEWGNPANNYEYKDPINKAPYNWRIKIQNEPEFKNGAFTQFRVLIKLKDSKISTAISNIIKSGGGAGKFIKYKIYNSESKILSF